MRRSLFSFLILPLCLTANASSFADEDDTHPFSDPTSIQAFEDRLGKLEASQGMLIQGEGALSVSGDVRFEFQSTSEKVNNINQRGEGSQYPDIPGNTFDVEVNLMFNYRAPRTWASVKIEFDNDAGATSGTVDSVALERAFLGARLVDAEKYNLDLEVGRQQLDYAFDSKIQFGSFFDGFLLKADGLSEKWGDLYIHGGPFVVTEQKSHFGFVLEAGVLSFHNTGLYAKYSFINWGMHGEKTYAEHLTYQFANSQVMVGYEFMAPKIQKFTNIYLAGLINSKAQSIAQTNYVLGNKAFYVGMSMGILKEPGDWAFDMNYQYVEPQAIPDFDANGIGRGNIQNSGLYTTKVNGAGDLTTVYNATGNANYKGVYFNLLYLFTKNLSLQQIYQQSINQNASVGPDIRFKQYEMEIIYAF